MAVRREQRACKEVRESNRACVMSAPTQFDIDSMLWFDFADQVYVDDDGILVFKKSVPQIAIDSYLMTNDESTMRIED